jgi:hypothetical protein
MQTCCPILVEKLTSSNGIQYEVSAGSASVQFITLAILSRLVHLFGTLLVFCGWYLCLSDQVPKLLGVDLIFLPYGI